MGLREAGRDLLKKISVILKQLKQFDAYRQESELFIEFDARLEHLLFSGRNAATSYMAFENINCFRCDRSEYNSAARGHLLAAVYQCSESGNVDQSHFMSVGPTDAFQSWHSEKYVKTRRSPPLLIVLALHMRYLR